MKDIALRRQADGLYDIEVEGRDLRGDDTLHTAVLISLLTDAERQDVEATGQQAGWWGDAYARPEGDRTGSLLYLMSREKMTPQARVLYRDRALAALEWLKEDSEADAVEVEALREARSAVSLVVEISASGQREAYTVPAGG